MSELLRQRRATAQQRRGGFVQGSIAPQRVTRPTPAPQMSARDLGPGMSLLDIGAEYRAQKEARQSEQNNKSAWGRGMGVLLNNPITSLAGNAIKPLEFIDKGRRLATLGVEEFAEAVGGRELKTQVDPKTGEVLDPRSNWDKLNDPTYGVGQLLGDIVNTGNPAFDKWANRTIGFVGDVSLDPVSYVSGIGGAVTKGGAGLNKANRAGLAAQALDAGNDVADVERFVRRGVGAVDDKFLDSIGAQRSMIRFNSIIPSRSPSISLGAPKGRAAQAAFGAPGAVGDVARRTRPGQRVAKWRTPKELETSYDRLFNAAGPATTRSAANRVAIANVERVAQNTFKQVNDEAAKPLKAKLRKLTDSQKSLLIDNVESGTSFTDEALESLRREYSAFLDDLLGQAQELGLSISRRGNYSPHILTRDATRWLRKQQSGAAQVGLVTQDLYHPSGITMRRQFQPGQTLEVNGAIVKFDDGVPVTVEQVNRKFRDAGLNFDFYESNPAIALEKYLDMLSSDVGHAQGIMSRVGKKSVHELTDEEVAALGQGVLLRGGGKIQEGDLEEVRGLLGLERAPGQPEIFDVQRSVRVEPQRTKGGKTKLTKSGKAQLADGADPRDLDLDTAVKWGSPIDETKEYNRTMAARASEQARRTGLQKDDAISAVEEILTGTTRNVQQAMNRGYEEVRASATAARRVAVDAIETVRSQGLRGMELETAIAQIDDALAQIAEDIPAMDRALARAESRVASQAIREERDMLAKEWQRLTTQIDDLRKGMRSGRAAFLTAQAEDLEATVRAPVEQARRSYEQAREAASESVGLNRVIQDRQRTLDDISFASAPGRAAEVPEGMVSSLQSRLRRLDEEIARLSKAVDADLPVAAAKRQLDLAERQAARLPSSGSGVPNVKPRKVTGAEAEILTGSQPMAPPPPRAGEIEDLISQQEFLTRRVAQLEQSVEFDKKMVDRSTPVKQAERRLQGARGMNNQPDIAAAEANLAKTRREEAMRLELNDDTAEMRRIQQKLNQVNRRLDQIANTKGATPDEVAAARKAVRETMERNLDPGAQLQAQRLRASASEAAGAGSRIIPDLAARRGQVGEELVGIVNDPTVRQAATERGVERLTRPITDAQQAPRAAAQRATGMDDLMTAAGGDSLTNRRRAYIDELAEINENLAASYRAVEEALTSREAAEEVLEESQRLLQKLNRKLYEGVDEAGNPLLARRPVLGDDIDAYEAATMWNVDALNEIVEAADLPMDVKVSTQHYLNEAIKAQDEVRQLDLTQKRWEAMRDAGKKGELGRVVEVMLADGWSAPYPHLVGDRVVMADDLHRMLQEVRSAAYHKDFWPVIDTFTNLFKTYATLTPGFHVRNAISAAFINATESIPMSTQLEGARLMSAYRRAADPRRWLDKQTDEIQEAFSAAFGSGIGGRYTERGIGQRGSLRYKTSERAFSNPVTRAGHWLGGMVEGSVRLPLALDTIRNGGNVQDALARVTRMHFDYSQTSQFDEIAKRFIPFWTFMSRNLPLQLTQMYTKPRSYAKYNSFVRNIRGEDEPGTPDYFGETGAFRLGETTLGGLPLYLQPDLAHSRLEEEIEKILNITTNPGRMLSDFNPLVTAPIEFTTGTDIYTGRSFKDTDVRSTGPLELPIALAALATRNAQRTPGGKVAVDERFINAMRAMIPVYDRSVRLAPGAVTGASDADANNRQLESWLRFLGFPVRQLSPQQQQATLRSQNFDRRDELAMRRALAKIDAG